MKIVQQGKVVVEKQRAEDGGGFLVMTPDGSIEHRKSRAGAEKHAKGWFKAHVGTDEAGIGIIEWR
jgi:hypothetical protein